MLKNNIEIDIKAEAANGKSTIAQLIGEHLLSLGFTVSIPVEDENFADVDLRERVKSIMESEFPHYTKVTINQIQLNRKPLGESS